LIRMFIDFSSLATSIGIGGLATSIGIGGLATSIGIGGFLGFLMGYAIKKILKIIIIVAGLLVGIIYYLQYNGLIALDWAKVEQAVSNLMTNFDGLSLNAPFFPGISDQIFNAISNSGIPLTGGYAAGFAFGFSKG
jgi:uncharacterized membrane protein (Fun14 family)